MPAKMDAPVAPPAPGGLPDEALASRVALGDQEALGLLVSRHSRRVYALLVRATGSAADADDLFQEVWLRVGARVATFDPSLPFTPWLARVASRVAIDWLRVRATSARRSVDLDAANDRATATPPVTAELESREARGAVSRALAELPDRLREALLLRYYEELSERDMSERLGVPAGTVKSRLHHALRRLESAIRTKEES